MAEEIVIEAPATISFSAEEMSQEREALLLECGSYPDKGLTVTEEDLDGMVARFASDGAPVKVEHVDSPLDPLGRVQRIWRDGSVLMAKLLFPADMASFLRRRGVQKLSVGLSRESGALGLAEVSLVLKPRVAAAAMFSDPTPGASADPSLGGKGEEGIAPQPPILGESESSKDAEIGRLRAELTAREVEGQITALKAQGRVVPAMEPWARALLSVPENALVTLSEGETPLPVSRAFLSYLEAQPPVVQFMETAGDTKGMDAQGRTHHHPLGDLKTLTPEEEAFLKKLGLDPQAVQHMMRHGSLPPGQTITRGN